MSGGRKLILSVAAGAALLCFGFFALAEGPPRTQGGDRPKVSESELRTFVKFYVEYQNIQRQYDPSLARAKGPEKKRIQDEANDKVVKALQKHNLTAEDYNRIFKLVNADEQLRKKTLKLVAEERKRP